MIKSMSVDFEHAFSILHLDVIIVYTDVLNIEDGSMNVAITLVIGRRVNLDDRIDG